MMKRLLGSFYLPLYMQEKDGTKRSHIYIGDIVEIVQKHHQRTGELTEGEVKRILTKSPSHPHGIKVQLTTGEVGRVKEIVDSIEDL